MKTIRVYLLCGLYVLWALPAIAAELDQDQVNEIEKAVATYQSETKTLQIGIVQKVMLEELKEPVVSKGMVYYGRGQGMRVEFSEPSGDYILMNKDVVVHKRGERRPRVYRLKTSEERARRTLLLDAFERPPSSWQKDYEVSMVRHSNEVTVQLIPQKNTAPEPQKIEVKLDGEQYHILSVRLYISRGQIQYEFSDHQQNISIKPQQLIWKD